MVKLFPIEMVRGRTEYIELHATDEESGAPIVLASGEVFIFGVKKDIDDQGDPIFAHAATATDEPGVYVVKIKPEDTADLPTGVYYYDIGLESGGEYLDGVKPSTFTIMGNATRKGVAYD